VLARERRAATLALFVAGLRGMLALARLRHVGWRWWTRDLGGLTDDTYGTLCEIVEVIALAALTATI